MKKALVLSLALILGLGFASFAETLSGSWDTEIGITIANQTVSYAGETISMPEQVLDCVGGSVTIPDQDIDVTVSGQTVTVTIPGGTYPTALNPANTVTIPAQDVDVVIADVDLTISIPGGTFDCTGGTVTIPAYDIVIAGHSHTITSIPVLAIDSVLTVTYAVSGWSFTSVTTIDETGWLGQKFEVGGALGAFTIGSTLVFKPAPPAFVSWKVEGGLNLAGVAFDATFTLVPNNTTLVIEASGTAGTVDVDVTVTFGQPDNGLCDFNFSGIKVLIDFPFCCADVSSEISFTCAGFQYVKFTACDIMLPGINWATLCADLTFTVTEKTLVVTPKFDFGAVACFDVYLSTPAALFGDISVVGLGIECEIGGVEFLGISYWGTGTKPSILKGTPYWEAYQIKTTDDGCCGPFSFDITVFFLKGGAMLFDVSAIESNFDIQISSQFTFGMGLELDFDVAPVFSNWTLHFLVEW